MSRLPPIELLEATHSFPGLYVFKIIGTPEEHLVARVVAAVRDELLLAIDPPYSLRKTDSGSHVAITLELTVSSAQEIHDVYRRIMTIPGVVLML